MINKVLHFDDLSSFWGYAIKDSNAYTRSSRSNSDIHWTGGLTWDEATKQAQSVWPEGLKQIEKIRAIISPIITKQVLRPRPTNAMYGYSVDVGSYLSNDPECFFSQEYEQRNYPGKIFKLVVSISFSAQITPKTIIQRGAMICALIDALEYAGHRVEVVCDWAANSDYLNRIYKENKWWLEVVVTIKKANQPLDMSDLAFCLAHPAMLRRIMFSVAELNGWSDSVSNYGYPAEATEKGDMYIKEIFSGEVPDDNAIDWVIEQLKKLGVNLEFSDNELL